MFQDAARRTAGSFSESINPMVTVTPDPSQSPPSAVAAAKPAAQLWAIERAILWVGRYPKAAGKFLDKLAMRHDIIGLTVRYFSSVTLGIIYLGLIAVYMALGSGLPSLRAYFDVSTMEFFDAPPLVIMLLLLAVTLIVVTLRRIPLTLYKLGVWTVHTGIITLIIGCFFYFGLKHEGLTRIFLNSSVRHYYDASDRAAYLEYKDGMTKKSSIVELKSLPIFDRRTPQGGNPLNITIPQGAIDGLSPSLKGYHVKIIGYFPYSRLEGFPIPRTPGTDPRRPAIEFNIGGSHGSGGEWLIGNSPRARVTGVNSPFVVEYLYHPSQRRLRDITQSFSGTHALIVRVNADHVRRVYPFRLGEKIKVAGTPYKLVPRHLMTMPLISSTYNGAISQACMINVTRKTGGQRVQFQRVALFRYPTQSVDFVVKNGRRKLLVHKFDRQLHIRYLDATRDQFWVVEKKSGQFLLVHRKPGGAVSQKVVSGFGKPIPISMQGIKSTFTLVRDAEVALRPHLIPAADRRPKVENTMGHCILLAKITGPNGFTKHLYVPFQQFGFHGDLPPISARLPNGGKLSLIFSEFRRAMPISIKLLSCKEVFFPGGHSFPRDFISKVRVRNLRTGKAKDVTIHLNHPAQIDGLHIFQARFGKLQNGQPFTVLGVGNTHGFYAMLTGVIMIIAGIGYAFYIKPILINVKKKQLAQAVGLMPGRNA